MSDPRAKPQRATSEELERFAEQLLLMVTTLSKWQSTRELSLVKTKIEEAELWLGRAMIDHANG